MVGSAIDSSELSTISTKKAMQRAAIGIHAARNDAYVPAAAGLNASTFVTAADDTSDASSDTRAALRDLPVLAGDESMTSSPDLKRRGAPVRAPLVVHLGTVVRRARC